MAQSDRLYFRADEHLREDVDAYAAREDFDTQSAATRKLVEVGLREQQHPIVWRFKDRVIEWTNLLSISAVVVFALGLTTDLIPFAQGVLGALVLVSVASVLIAGFEFARTISGMNTIGVQLRNGVNRVVGGSDD